MVASLVVSCLLAVSALADTPSPLAWRATGAIDPLPYPRFGATTFQPTTLDRLSCPSTALCVAVDNAGNIATSTDPSEAWNVAQADVGNAILGVSCPSVDLCVAVDNAGNVLTATNPTGGKSAWTVTNVISGAYGLVNVVCPSVSLCVAVSSAGRVVTSTNPTGGAAAWTTAILNSGSDLLYGVSCPSISMCVAAARAIYTATNPTGGASAWTRVGVASYVTAISCPSTTLCIGIENPGTVQTPGDLIVSTDPADGATATWTNENVDGNNSINAITCVSASLCVAVDANGNTLTSTNPTAGAPAWTISKILPGPSAYGPGAFSDVSCVSAPMCVAIDGTSMWATFAPTAGASAWSQANTAVPIYGVSCPSTSLCVGVDDIGNVLTSTNPSNGTPTVTVTKATGPTLLAISCPGTTLCVATDVTGGVVTSTNPTGGASAWTASTIDGTEAISAISCPTTTFCAAVDDAGNVLTSTNPAGGAGAWQTTHIDGSALIYGISCPTASFCAAVDDSGNVLVSTDPTGGAGAWQTRSVDPANLMFAISCASDALCVAVDDAGNAITSTAPASATPRWTSARVDYGPLNAISCPSTQMCVAVDGFGFEVNSIDPAGGASEWTGTRITGGILFGVSCPDTSGCAAVDGNGNAAWGGATPSNLTLPSISGQAIQGSQLAEVHGTWAASPAGYRLQWERCNATGGACSDISGATGSSYVLVRGDVGSTIRVLEEGSNASGDGVAVESAQSAVVQALPSAPPPPPPAGGSSGGSGSATIKHVTVSSTSTMVVVSCGGTAGANCSLKLSLTVKETLTGGKVIAITTAAKPKKKVVVLGTRTVTLGAGQTEIIKVSLNPVGTRLLFQRHTLNVKLAITQSGKAVFSTTITFKTKPKKKH